MVSARCLRHCRCRHEQGRDPPQYELANRLGEPAFIRRPYIGSPAAAAQAETNISNIWGHLNSGFLFAYEYTRWWQESAALRSTQDGA